MSLYTVKPNALWGWDPTLLVEIEALSERFDAKPVARVYLDRVPIGFVFGREDHTRKSLEYGHALVSGKFSEPPPLSERITYPSSSRLAAITALVEAHLRKA